MSSDVYVFFCEAKRPRWWMRWLKQGFSHCFVVEPFNGDWVKYEYGNGAYRADVITKFDDLIAECIIIKVKKRDAKGLFRINSCVGFVKSIIGDNSLCVTPYGLFRRLSKWR